MIYNLYKCLSNKKRWHSGFMQLADNPITKVIFEKLKFKDFNNLSNLIYDQERIAEFQFKFHDFKIDITRQTLDKEIKNDLINLAKKAKIKSQRKDSILQHRRG